MPLREEESCTTANAPNSPPPPACRRAPTKGGHTVFPDADATPASARPADAAYNSDWYCQSDEVLGAQVSTAAGDAVLFWDYMPGEGGDGSGSYADGTAKPSAMPVPQAQHSGCPVLEGEKWIATRWIR